MDLSALASAWAGAQEGERQYKQRPVDDKRRELELATHQAGLDLLPQRTQLVSDMLRTQQGEVQFGLDTQPARQAIEKSDLDFKQSEQPGLQTLERNRNKIAASTVDTEIKTLPGKIFNSLVQGAITEDQARDTVFSTIGQKVIANDKDGLLQFANGVAAIPGFFPNTNGKKFVDVQPIGGIENGIDTRAYRMVTSDGTYKDVPHSQLEAAMQRQKTSELKTVKPGESLVGVKGGRASVLFTAPESVKGASQHTPAEVQTAEWLLKNGVARNANEAWEKVRSARDKSETGFITDMMAKHKYASPEEITNLEQTYRAMYRRIHAGNPEVSNTPGSNTQGVPTIGPRVKELLGIPQ